MAATRPAQEFGRELDPVTVGVYTLGELRALTKDMPDSTPFEIHRESTGRSSDTVTVTVERQAVDLPWTHPQGPKHETHFVVVVS